MEQVAKLVDGEGRKVRFRRERLVVTYSVRFPASGTPDLIQFDHDDGHGEYGLLIPLVKHDARMTLPVVGSFPALSLPSDYSRTLSSSRMKDVVSSGFGK
jgi:hypothetical protein